MRARAPASSANLGPGFDTLAVALDRYVEVEVEPASRLIVRSEGEGAGLSDDPSHLAARVAIDVAGHDHLAITVRSEIPIARGLGSSAALAAAAAAAAGAKDPLAVATQVEGHPDNAAASVVGGLIAATMVRGGVRAVRLALDVSLVFVVIVPDLSLATTKARQVLPTEVVRESAAFNLGRLALLIAGLADSRVLISEATEDRLHQDYRSPLFPAAPQLLSGLSRAGALAVCWSGAGPALLGICKGSEGAAVQAATQEVMAETRVPGEVLLLRADLEGLVVDKNGSGDFWKDRKPTWERNQPGADDSPSGPLDPGVTKGAGVAKGPGAPGDTKDTGGKSGDGNQLYDFDSDH
ncbi:MAG: homoserine kinase [Acidimicrobiales bacterium]